MSDLEIKRLRMQVKKADAAIAELEFKIEERMEDIQRMKTHIELQNKVKTTSLESLNEMGLDN